MTTVRRLAHSPLSYTNFDEHSIFFHNKTINTVTSKTYLTTHYATRITHPQRSTHNAHLSSSSPQPDDFVATMSTSPQNKDCPLLEMPIETLQRITDLLDTHGDLPSVRLTCKTLDYVTLERFVSASFSTVKCCIFYESRWIRLMKIVSGPSRITRKIQKIDLTTCFFEDRDPSEIRLAPRKPSPNHTITALTNPYYKAFKAHNKAEAVAVQHLPNLALMSRVLRDIEKVFPPGVVTLYLIESQHCPNRYIDAHRDALFTLASAHSLRLYGRHLGTGRDLRPSASRLATLHLWAQEFQTVACQRRFSWTRRSRSRNLGLDTIQSRVSDPEVGQEASCATS
jgi:hypothetical protein